MSANENTRKQPASPDVNERDPQAGAAPGPTLSVSSSTRSAAPGERVTWTFAVANPADQAFAGVSLECLLPAPVRFLTAAGPATLRPDPAGRLVWALDPIAPGAAVRVTVTGEVSAASGQATTVRVSGLLEVSGVGETRASAPAVSVDVPALTLLTEVSAAEAEPGDVLLYTVSWGCDGSVGVAGVEVSLELPSHTRLVSATGGGRLDEERLVRWSLGRLKPGRGDAAMVTVRVDSVLPSGATDLSAIAELSAPGLSAPIRAAAATTMARATAQLTGSLRCGSTRAAPGDDVRVLLAVTNTGTAAARGVQVQIPASERARPLLEGEPVPRLELDVGDVAVGETASVDWQLRLDSAFPRGNSTVVPSARIEQADALAFQTQAPGITVSAEPRIAVALTLDHGEGVPGATLAYVATYRNVGSAAVEDLTVAIPLPEYSVAVPELTTGAVDASRRQLLVRLGDLGVGEEGRIRLGVRLAAVFPAGITSLTTSAFAAGRDLDQVTSDPIVVRVNAAPSLSVVATTSARSAVPGDSLVVIIRCANDGAATASGVLLSTTIPERCSAIEVEGNVSADTERRELVWSFDTLSPGQQLEVRLRLRVDSGFSAGDTAVELRSGASWDDGVASSEPVRLVVSAAPSLELRVEPLQPTASPGDTVLFRLFWRNVGNAVADDARISLKLPELGTASGIRTLWTDDVGELAVGVSGDAEVAVTLGTDFPAGETHLAALAIVEFRGVSGPATETVESSAICVLAQPQLSLTATVDRDAGEPGGSLAVKLECINTGNAAATALLIRASLPDGATLVSRSGRGADQASEALAWTGEALPPGQRATFGYVLGLPECYPAGQTDLPITASAECRDTGAVATALASIRVLAAPQLTLKASVEPRRAVPGDVVRAVVATGNVGNAVGTGAVMVVSVPAGTRPLEISRGGRHDQAAGLVSWELEPLPITGAEQACSISLALDSSFDPGATELAVRATVTSAASVAEAETGFVVDAAPEADISLVSDRAEPSPSEPVQYTLRVANNGTAPVQVVELIDPLPLRCSFVSATHGGSYDSGGNSARWLLGPIAAGASIEVMLTVRLDREFPLGLSVVGNQATVRFDDLSVVDSLEHQLEVTAVPVLTPAVQCVTLDAHPGQEVVLTVACEAGGHAPAESTRLRLQLPDCMTPLPARSLSDGVVDAVARTVDWTLGTVSPGTRTEAVVTVLLDPVMPAGDTAHEVTVCVTSDHTEPAEVSTAVVVEAAPRLELSLAFGAEQVSPGELIPLTLAVVNVGDAASARVVVSVPLPEAFEAPEEPGSDTLTWEVGPLDGGGASARRVVSVSPRYEFPVGITRVAISGAATVEDGTVSGCAPATLDVLAEPGLSIGCDVSQQEVTVGERVSTTFEVRNVGHVPLDAVQLRAVLPPGLRAVGAGGDARVVAHEPDGVHWEIDRLPRGKSSILTLAVVPEPGFAHGQTTISHGLVITAPALAAAVESAPVTLVVNAEATLAGSCIVATSSGAAADGVVAVSPGQRLAVSWQLSNTGTGSAPAGTFEVMLPDGLVPEQVGAEGQVSEAGAITWPVEPPAPGDRLVLQASLRVTRDFPRGATRLSLGGVFTGAGPVVAVQPALLDVVAEPRVEAATLMDRRVYAPGASLAFSLRLANHGTASADALTISVRPDPRVTPVWVEGGRLDEITGAVCWDVPELLADGEPIELRWDGRLSTAFAVGDSVLSQPIEIVGAPLELAPTSWTVRAEQPVAASVDIDPAVAEPGDRVRILVRVGTTGRQVPADVSIQLPDGLHAVEDTLRQVIAGPEETTTTFDAVVQSSLPSGNTSLPVGVTIDAGATQLQHSLELLARVAPELAVSAVVIGALPTAPGQTLSLAVTCRVAGRADARDLVIWVPLPAGSEAVEAKDAQRVSPGGRRMLRWPLGAAVPGDVVTRTCVLALPDSLEAGEHVLDFTPGADATGVDLVYASPVHARVRAAPVLGVTAALDPPVALPGESVSLSLVLANTGDAPARRLVLACDLPGGERRWAVDDLAPGATEEAVVPFDAPTDLPPGTHELAIGASLASSDLALSASSGGPDDFAWRAEAPVRLVVAALPRLQITAACDRHSAAPGDPVTWSLTVKNVGHAPALGVVVTDRLPERGRFLEAASGGEWHAEQACVVWALGDLAPEDQGRVLTWRAAIADTIPAGNHVFAHAPSVVADGTGSEPIVSGVTEVAVEAWPQLAVSLEVTDADGKPLQGPLEAGDLARVRARLVNSGPAAAVPATLSLELPPALRLAEGDSQWVVAELASGESAEQLLSVQVGSVLPVGLTSHLMRLTAATPDIADVQARVGISVRAAAQLEVAASCVRPLVGPGDEVEVVVAYSVSGTAHADGLVVSLTLPARVHLVEALDGGEGPTDPRARDIRWTPGQRAVGDTGQLRARLRLDKGLANDFVLPISVAARADGVDPVVGEVLELRVRAVPRLSLDLHSEQSTIRPGERIRYVLTVANSGRAPAADILVTNPLPPGLALENATHGGHYDDLADAVVWRLPLLAQGQANKLSWTARVASEFASGATAVTNVAAAALMVGDERISAEAEFTATVVARPELRVGVQLGRLSAHAGETVPCELAWANGGDARASGTTVGVELPAGVSEVHREDGGVLERAGNRVFWPVGSMGPAEEGRAMLLLTLQRPMPRGRVEVPITGVVNSLEVPEIRGIAMLEVQARPVLAVGAIIEQAYARPGDLLHFELQWSNAGGSDAPGGVLAVPLPTGATLASARPEAVLDSSTDTLRWALGDLGAGASGTVRLTLQARTDLEAGETRLVVVPALHAGDDTAEVAEPAEVVIQAAPRLSVELTASDPSPEPGAMVSWAVRLRNVGDAEARRLNLSLPLPQRVTLLSVNGGATRWDPAMRTARVSVGAIPPGDTCDLEVTARLESVFPAGVTPLVVRAEVACDGSPNVWSEPVEVGVRASSQPAVSVVWGAEQATPGQTVEAAITVANTGNADVPSAVLRLELPDGTRVEEGARAEWVGNTLSWSPARLEAGAEQTIAVSLILAPSFAAGTTRALARAVLEMEATDGPDSADVAEVAEEAAIWVHAAPSLSVTLATAIRDVRPGRELPVFVVVSNTGTGPAAAAQLSLALPARCRLSDESTPEDTATAHNVTLDLGDVAAGGRVERELSLTLDPEFPAGTTSLGISASVEADAAAASEDASLTLAVHATPDLELSLTSDTATPTLGGVVTWQVHWHNRGDAPATNVRLFVRPAEHTTLEHAGPIEVGTMRPGQRGENVVVTRLLECFPAGESNVSPEVSVACTESPQCRVPTPPLIVSAASDLQVRIESETSVAMAAVGTRVATRSAGSADTVSESEAQMMPVGANLVFTLYITNAGSAPAQDAAVQHDLPPGSQFISASQGGAYDRGAHRVTWSLGTVGPGIEPLVRTATVRFGG